MALENDIEVLDDDSDVEIEGMYYATSNQLMISHVAALGF